MVETHYKVGAATPPEDQDRSEDGATAQLAIRLPRAIYRGLKDVSMRERRSLRQQLIYLIERYVEQYEQQGTGGR